MNILLIVKGKVTCQPCSKFCKKCKTIEGSLGECETC